MKSLQNLADSAAVVANVVVAAAAADAGRRNSGIPFVLLRNRQAQHPSCR